MAKNDKPSFKVSCSICGKRSSTTNKKYKKEKYVCQACRKKLNEKKIKKKSKKVNKKHIKKPAKKRISKKIIKKIPKPNPVKKPVKELSPHHEKNILTKDFPQINTNTKIDVNDLDSDLPIDLEKYLNAFRHRKIKKQHPNLVFTKLFVITALLFILCFIIYKLIFG